MIDQEINIAIAEACGWKWYRLPHLPSNGDRRYRCLFFPSILESDGKIPDRYSVADMTERVCNWEYMKREGMVFDYCQDLNAMHAAEESLSRLKRCAYGQELGILAARLKDNRDEFDCFKLTHATARQRAEAFLRTIGKWKGVE